MGVTAYRRAPVQEGTLGKGRKSALDHFTVSRQPDTRERLVLASEFEQLDKLLDTQAMMGSNTLEDAEQEPGFERPVRRNHLMVFAIPSGCDAHMRTTLPCSIVVQLSKGSDQLFAADIARQSHRAMSSSRMK